MTAATDAFPETSARQQPRRRHNYLKEHTGRAARRPVLAIKHSPRSDAWWTTSTARSSRWRQLGASQTIPQSHPVRLAAQLCASTAWRTCQCQMMRWSIETEMMHTTEVRSARREFIPKRGDSRYGSNIILESYLVSPVWAIVAPPQGQGHEPLGQGVRRACLCSGPDLDQRRALPVPSPNGSEASAGRQEVLGPSSIVSRK